MQADASSRVIDEWASSGAAARGPGDAVAWTSFVPLESGQSGRSLVHVRHPRWACGEVATAPWPGRAAFTVAGFVGDRVVVDGAFQLPVALLAPDGRNATLRRLASATDVSGPWIAGSLDPDGDHAAVVDSRTGHRREPGRPHRDPPIRPWRRARADDGRGAL